MNGKWIDLKHFIELPNADKEVVIDKAVVEEVNNLPNIGELNAVVDPEFDVVERKDFTNIDVSIISDIDEGDSDKESEEDNAIFIGDRELDSQREYIKNFVISILPNLRLYQRTNEI
jgi:hypothetical protein